MLMEENAATTENAEDSENILSNMEIDAIGEIMNISMGSAATAISSMLDKQVTITTPRVSVQTLRTFNYHSLEPAISVKITYIEGITGSNVMVFRQKDMQLILNQLMGIDEPPTDDFVFDELSMSAACEVMNQMMGASATALSEFLGRTINISTPSATIMDQENSFQKAIGVEDDEKMILIQFDLTISDIMKSQFVSILTSDLAKMIVGQLMSGTSTEAAPPASAKPPVSEIKQESIPVQPAAPSQGLPTTSSSMPPQPQQAPPQMPTMQTPPVDVKSQYPPVQPPYPYPPMPMGGYPQYGYPMYPPMNYPGMPDPSQQANAGVLRQPVNIQNVQFPDFSNAQVSNSPPITGGNMDLIMNVPLSVSIEIGKTKRKIKDILDFSQGTVIELDKQAGAPVDIVVNGQLIARGDVVVIDDNFGVRVSEIIGTKEIISTITGKQ